MRGSSSIYALRLLLGTACALALPAGDALALDLNPYPAPDTEQAEELNQQAIRDIVLRHRRMLSQERENEAQGMLADRPPLDVVTPDMLAPDEPASAPAPEALSLRPDDHAEPPALDAPAAKDPEPEIKFVYELEIEEESPPVSHLVLPREDLEIAEAARSRVAEVVAVEPEPEAEVMPAPAPAPASVEMAAADHIEAEEMEIVLPKPAPASGEERAATKYERANAPVFDGPQDVGPDVTFRPNNLSATRRIANEVGAEMGAVVSSEIAGEADAVHKLAMQGSEAAAVPPEFVVEDGGQVRTEEAVSNSAPAPEPMPVPGSEVISTPEDSFIALPEDMLAPLPDLPPMDISLEEEEGHGAAGAADAMAVVSEDSALGETDEAPNEIPEDLPEDTLSASMPDESVLQDVEDHSGGGQGKGHAYAPPQPLYRYRADGEVYALERRPEGAPPAKERAFDAVPVPASAGDMSVAAPEEAMSADAGHVAELQPAAAPSSWRAVRGADVRETLDFWSRDVGVTLIWTPDWVADVRETVDVSGPYEDAVQALLDQFSNVNGKPVVGTLYIDPSTQEKTLVVEHKS